MNMNVMKVLVIAIGIFLSATGFSQTARSLYSSGTGVTFDNKQNEANGSSTKKTQPTEKIVEKPDLKTVYAGLSYSIYKQMPDGSVKKVSPKTVFNSGDRIRVDVTPNTGGSLRVININPEGKSVTLATQVVKAGNIVTVPQSGYLKFVGAPGIEQLVFILTDAKEKVESTSVGSVSFTTIINACSGGNNTRSLVQDDAAGNQFNVVNPDGTCANRPSGKATRSLVVDVDQDTGYGVVPSESLKTGQVLTLKVKLRHE